MAEITRRGAVDPDHRLPPGDGASPSPEDGRRRDPEAVRRDIEATRARMSRTLDEIEGRLVRRKEELVARATLRGLRRKLGAEPWRSLALAFVAGYVVAAIRD